MQINAAYKSKEFIEKFRESFRYQNSKKFPHVVRPDDAFPIAVLPDLLPNEQARAIKHELLREDFYEKHNDLYEFLQSDDLKNTKSQILQELYSTFKSDAFIEWMSELTGIELTRGRLDLAGQRYLNGGRLLCHDDDIKSDEIGRRIAFIFYLVPRQWTINCGGNLDIFRSEQGKPAEVVHKIVPQWNSLAFFEVTPTSFHSVSEVLSTDERVSITGWFYGPVPKEYCKKRDTREVISRDSITIMRPLMETCNRDAIAAARWIRSMYLESPILSQISESFMEQSYIELADFLKEDIYVELLNEFNGCIEETQSHQLMLPPTHHQYRRVCKHRPLMKEFLDFVSSTEFSRYMKQITGLDLRKNTTECRFFKPGDYTLMSDETMECAPALDCYFSFSASEWNDENGGSSLYVADEETLLQIAPGENKMTLVYRDEGVMRFVDYLTHRCTSTRKEISVTYTE